MPTNIWESLEALGAVTVTVKNTPDLIWLLRRLRATYPRFRLTVSTLEDRRLLVTVAVTKEIRS